mgnify:CR=1 FL=1
MKQPTVYLAGPIAGLTQSQATTWRDEAAKVLAGNGIQALQPIIPIAVGNYVIPALADETRIAPLEIFNVDMELLNEADVVLVGYPTGPRLSVGTAVEVGYAYAQRKPIVIWVQPKQLGLTLVGSEKLHPFLTFIAKEGHDHLFYAVAAAIRYCHEPGKSSMTFEPRPPEVGEVGPAGGGLKADAEKLPLGLMPRSALEQVAAVLAHGALKYGPHNWRKGIVVQRNIDAALRHILAANEGEDLDVDSGLPHFAHAICDLMFVIETLRVRPELDDRFHRPAAAARGHVYSESTTYGYSECGGQRNG